MLTTTILQAQDCYDCDKRKIYVYDLEIQLPAPVADHDSIMNFYNALKITPAIVDYLKNSDPTRECIIPETNSAMVYLDTTRALNDPVFLSLSKTIPFHEPDSNGEIPDYYISGYIEPDNNMEQKYLFVDFFLQSSQKDVLGSGFADLYYYPSGDIQATVTKAMSEKLGNAFQKIRDFEVKKRDSGIPYAIHPTLTGTSAKSLLDFNEVSTIHFILTDCDGVALKNRTITISDYYGGTLDKTSFITDDNGEANLQFTAGTTPGIAGIVPSFSYTKPCGKPGNMDLKPIFIEIKRPADSWFVTADYKFTESGKHTYSDVSNETRSGSSQINENIHFSAWVKAYPLPFPLPGYFVSDPALINIKFTATRNESGQENKFWANSAGYMKDNSWTNITADALKTATPELNINIGGGDYNFNINKLTAVQNGGSHRIYDTWDVVGGYYYDDTTFPADPTTELYYSFQDVTSDTVYSYREIIDNGDTDERTSVSQSCQWIDKESFSLYYEKHFISETNTEDPLFKEYSNLIQDYRLVVNMLYNDATNSIWEQGNLNLPKEFELYQNYPNPFNPITTIKYSIPASLNPSQGGTFVKLELYDILGKEVATLVNEEKPAGNYQVEFDGSKFSSGIYFYSVEAIYKNVTYRNIKKMVLLK
jgi:hypothetical protein